MVGFEGYLHLAELPGDILRRSLQSSARQFGQHLLYGRTGDVYARAEMCIRDRDDIALVFLLHQRIF